MKRKQIVRYLSVLLLIIVCIAAYTKKPFNHKNLVSLSVTAQGDIKTTSGRSTDFGCYFFATDYNARFTIDNCINFICDRNIVKEIQRGDKLAIMFESWYLDELADPGVEVPIFSLAINNSELFSPDRYLLGQKKQHYRRLALFSILILGLLLLCTDKIKSKTGWTLLIVYAVIIFVLIEKQLL